jgi:hypothetical protein
LCRGQPEATFGIAAYFDEVIDDGAFCAFSHGDLQPRPGHGACQPQTRDNLPTRGVLRHGAANSLAVHADFFDRATVCARRTA